jgi:hypothetical protein
MVTRTGSISAENSQAASMVDALGERMDKGFTKIEDMLLRFEERLRAAETREAGCQPIVTARMDAAWRKIDLHDAELSSQRQSVTELAHVVNRFEGVARWILGIITTLIAAVLIAFLTGKIDIVFR